MSVARITFDSIKRTIEVVFNEPCMVDPILWGTGPDMPAVKLVQIMTPVPINTALFSNIPTGYPVLNVQFENVRNEH